MALYEDFFVLLLISPMKLTPMAAGFSAARLIFYAFLVHASSVYVFVQESEIQNLVYVPDIIGLLATVPVIFVDWRNVFQHTQRFST